jgi:hypothetical protein
LEDLIETSTRRNPTVALLIVVAAIAVVTATFGPTRSCSKNAARNAEKSGTHRPRRYIRPLQLFD